MFFTNLNIGNHCFLDFSYFLLICYTVGWVHAWSRVYCSQHSSSLHSLESHWIRSMRRALYHCGIESSVQALRSVHQQIKQFATSASTWLCSYSNYVPLRLNTGVWFFNKTPHILYMCPQHASTSSEGQRSPKDDMDHPYLSTEESTTTNLLRAKDSLSMLIESPYHTHVPEEV